MTIFKVGPSGQVVSSVTLGDKLAFDERPILYRHPVFTLDLDEGRNDFVVKVTTTSIVRFDFVLFTPKSFRNAKLPELVIFGVLMGGMFFIVVYNFFLFLTTRDRSYGLYVAYAAAYFVYSLGFYGLLPYFVFSTEPNSPLTGWDLYMVIDVIIIFCVLFTNSFLHLKKESRFFYWTMNAFAIVASVNLLANSLILHGSVPALKSVSLASILLMGFVLIAAGIRMIFKGFTPAYYFTFAWTCLVAGNTIGMAANLGVLDPSALSKWGSWWVSTWKCYFYPSPWVHGLT
ncbi:MAG: hypothetical protein HRU19_28610 [Pseudobacteriovorax sp.]|nr:hypothetical protein [Pseudobacteriovorax sp.]